MLLNPTRPYLLQHHIRVIVHDGEMLLIVIQVIECEGPKTSGQVRIGS